MRVTHASRRSRRTLVGMTLLVMAASLAGCAVLAGQPELAPERYAPPVATQPWTPPVHTAQESAIPASERVPDRVPQPPPATGPTGVPTYDLAQLIEIALANNPQTRGAWEHARAAAAAYGASRAAYYPTVTATTPAGYTRQLDELPNATVVSKEWYAAPTLQLTYRLLDFGRRDADDELARQQLASANFAFNRELQTVVFTTQRAFYALAAAKAGVTAAEETLKLTKTDHDVAQQRVGLGLATQPELLLARARVAQAEYDLANAQLFVQQGQAALALAIGVAANAPFDVESLQNQHVPQSFGREVDQLIAEAVRRRPDLAAQVATLNARQAGIDRARAAFYPTVDALANYGEQLWNFQFGGPFTQKPIQPQYTGQLMLNWDLFTGFARLNQLRQAEAERAAAAAALQAGELSAIAEVWRAYYEFVSTQKKYAYAQALLTASQESYAANLDTYTQGLSTIVELLTAERDLANARFTLIQSTADVLTASAVVAYAMGAIEAPRWP
jgi:outer membrane protein